MAPKPPETVEPQVRDKRVPPTGIIPKNMQAVFLCSVAAVMLIVIVFSGRTAPKERSATATPQTAAIVDPNAERIKAYQARIEEQARKLQLEQARLARAEQTVGATAPGSASDALPNPVPPPTYNGAARYAGGPSVDADAWDRERAKREYHGLFASNVALSFRKGALSAPTEESPRMVSGTDSLAKALALYAAARANAGAEESNATGSSARGVIRSAGADERPGPSGPEEPRSGDRARSQAREADAAFRQTEGKVYRLFEGTVLETVLTNRLDGSFSGPINCMVTTHVYSHSGQHLMIPQGTRVLGEVRRVESFGQQRLAVFFHRLIMPDGYSASLDQFQGLNAIGETGLRDQVNHHYMQVFGISLAIGAIAGLGQVNTRGGNNASAADLYQQGVEASLSQSSLRILDRYLNVLPTMTIREGYRVRVYLSDDLLLPAYEAHHIPIDF